ncbi:DMT family transporter [Reyranella sp. CPCC 100927]|uniref:DMT family transporter n=1 Tax=Reyranella sp. CPCC 100927 TaxID=2599616 RepID=UPI0011B66E48|nr:DMT family transporter [Reyranella sp. CPCC 100927]TWT14905.1 DMT family transporter [Reyranella sp. CPCC 100927]
MSTAIALPPSPIDANRRGIVAMAIAMTLFIVNDALIKLAAETLPAGQAILIRGAFATILALIAVLAMGHARALPQITNPHVLVRATLDVLCTFGYLIALFNMPISIATAINMATPLAICVLAVLLLREHVGWRRWSAVMAGFAGVLLIIRPTPEGLNWWALLAFGATVLNGARDVYTRRIGGEIPSIVITLSTALGVTLCAAVVVAIEGWQPVAWREFGLLAAASLFLASGYHLVIVAMRAGEVSLVGAFRYTGMLGALALGYGVWGETPDLLSWLGIALLVGAGLYILHRERVRARG